jgi:hypothetical protein
MQRKRDGGEQMDYETGKWLEKLEQRLSAVEQVLLRNAELLGIQLQKEDKDGGVSGDTGR